MEIVEQLINRYCSGVSYTIDLNSEDYGEVEQNPLRISLGRPFLELTIEEQTYVVLHEIAHVLRDGITTEKKAVGHDDTFYYRYLIPLSKMHGISKKVCRDIEQIWPEEYEGDSWTLYS